VVDNSIHCLTSRGPSRHHCVYGRLPFDLDKVGRLKIKGEVPSKSFGVKFMMLVVERRFSKTIYFFCYFQSNVFLWSTLRPYPNWLINFGVF